MMKLPWQKIVERQWSRPEVKRFIATVVWCILNYAPERLLILEQLLYAKKHGRELSKAAQEEVAELEEEDELLHGDDGPDWAQSTEQDNTRMSVPAASVMGNQDGPVSRGAGHTTASVDEL